MKKIPTIFERDWNGDKRVIDKTIDGLNIANLANSVATEKIDGTNVRITVRNKTVVRAEKRRNPDRIQKHKGIEDPWYVDATDGDPQDKYIFDGIKNTDFLNIPDGEWSGELVGINIQGNPLKLENNRIVFFTLGQAPVFTDVPLTYEGLKEWLPKQKSKYGNDCGIEGIVWHTKEGYMFKIKTKDFIADNRN